MKTTVQIHTLEPNRRIMDRNGCIITEEHGSIKFEIPAADVIFRVDHTSLKIALSKLDPVNPEEL